MLRLAWLAPLAPLLVSASCVLVFDDNDPVPCASRPQPDIAYVGLRNPQTLSCEFSEPPPSCDSRCGPCPEYDQAPRPSWGSCASTCDGRAEAACEKAGGCRAVRDAGCLATDTTCVTTFAGCFPTDTQTSSIDCFAADDGDACSRDDRCTAWHEAYNTPRRTPEIARPFVVCAPEGVDPGRCDGVVTCDEAPPVCGDGRVPGIAGGCYTGACLPAALCVVPLAPDGLGYPRHDRS